jgi:hypothetical protein
MVNANREEGTTWHFLLQHSCRLGGVGNGKRRRLRHGRTSGVVRRPAKRPRTSGRRGGFWLLQPYSTASREYAAKMGGMNRQTLRNCVIFDEEEPEGLRASARGLHRSAPASSTRAQGISFRGGRPDRGDSWRGSLRKSVRRPIHCAMNLATGPLDAVQVLKPLLAAGHLHYCSGF